MDKKEKEKPTILKRAAIAFLSAVIGAVLGALLIIAFGAVSLDEIAGTAILASLIFAILGFVFPKFIIRVLFVLTLFQP